jgi:type IV pilus assembly protein PilA
MNSSPTERREDKGFTLIELMVVVLIIAILLAIAIPTFLGAQNKAKDRSAQSSARNALTNAKTIFADNGDYADATIAALTSSEPSLVFVATKSTGPKSISVLAPVFSAAAPGLTWYAAVLSDTGTCFYIRDSVNTAAAAADQGTTYAKATPTGDCIATAPAASLRTGRSGDSATLGVTRRQAELPTRVGESGTSGRDDRQLGARCVRPERAGASPRFPLATPR